MSGSSIGIFTDVFDCMLATIGADVRVAALRARKLELSPCDMSVVPPAAGMA
jgi:hypothetical protein